MGILQQVLDNFSIKNASPAAIESHLVHIRTLFNRKLAYPKETYPVNMRLPVMGVQTVNVPIIQKVLEEKYPLEYLALWIEYDADINCTLSPYGETPLHYCIAHALNDKVNLLLQHGADYNKKNNEGFTPLMTAVDESNTHAVDQLLQHPVILKTKNNNGHTALNIADICQNEYVADKIESAIADRARRGNPPVRFSNPGGNSREEVLHRTIKNK